MTWISKGQTESFCVQQPLPIVKSRKWEGQRLVLIYWQLEAMPPEKLEASFLWLCKSWIASWTCAVCIVFYFIHSQLRVSLVSLSPTVLSSSLSSQQSLTGTFLSYLPLSLCSPPPPPRSLPPSVSHSLPCCSQMAGFAQGLQAGIEHAWNNMFLLNLPSVIASWN